MTTDDKYVPPPEHTALDALHTHLQREDVLNAAVDLLKHWDGPALADVHPYAYYVNRLRLAVEKALRARER